MATDFRATVRPQPTRMPTPPKRPSPTPPGLSSLLEPFEEMDEAKQDLLREVLQVFVTKEASARSELEKRQRLTALINDYSSGEEDDS